MASTIRTLLSAAQSAEVKGDTTEAVRLLREAAAFYRDHKLTTRAMQMLRHARRLEGDPDPGPPLDGFSPRELIDGDDDFAGPTGSIDWSGEEEDTDDLLAKAEPSAEFERIIALCAPGAEAWCSFCCKPNREVGQLVSGGATGSFICAACLTLSAQLLGARVSALDQGHEPPPAASAGLLASQQAVFDQYRKREPMLALIIGPEGSGKSHLLEVLARAHPAVKTFDGALEPHGAPRAVIALRAAPPTPSLVLDGTNGPEPIFDTDTLFEAAGGHLSKSVLSRVDAVFCLEAMNAQRLTELAEARLQARGLTLPRATVEKVVDLALRSGRSAHELVALVARIPPGEYQKT